MPNHLPCIGIFRNPRKLDFVNDYDDANLCQLADPADITRPGECRERWGTKWGTYDTVIHIYEKGDESVAIVCFCCAWNAPNAATLEKISEFLYDRLGFEDPHWHSVTV